MEKYNLRKSIAECRSYEQNGLAEYQKAEIRGLRKDLESELDSKKNQNRLDYEDARWN
jgi:hypothetical protein